MLEKFLCIRRDERKIILFLSLLSFSWSIAVSFSVALSDALLLRHAGSAKFPIAYCITALGMFGFSGIFIYLYNRKDISQIFRRWIILSICFYSICFTSILLGTTSPNFFIFYKAFSYIVQIGFYSCFWSFVDQYFELQNAKRIFGIFYSAIFLGTAVSGAVLYLSHDQFGMALIFAITILSLISCFSLIYFIQWKFEKLPDEHEEFAVIKTGTKELIGSILTSPFTILLLSFCIMLQLLLVITEFEYMLGFENFFSGSLQDDLTPFLGKLYLFGALFNIIFGICIYGRLIKKAGLNNVILIVPLFFTSLFFGWFVSSHLLFSVMGFIAVEGVMTLVEDNNFTLLLNAVPLRLKNKIRVIIESLVEPFGILVSSGLMVIFQSHNKKLGLALSLIFLAVALLLRATYTKGIFYNLISHIIHFNHDKRPLKPSISKKDYEQSKTQFTHQFLNLKANEQFFLVECALKFNDLTFLKTLFEKITKLSDTLKLKVLDTLCDYPKEISHHFIPHMELWAQKSTLLNDHLVFHKAKMNLLMTEDLTSIKANAHHNISKALLELKKDPGHIPSQQTFIQHLLSKSEAQNLLAIEAIRFLPKHPFNAKLIDLLISKPTLKDKILKTLSISLSPIDSPFLSILLLEVDHENHLPTRKWLIKCIQALLNDQNLEMVISHSVHWKDSERKSLLQSILTLGLSALPLLLNILKSTDKPLKTRLLASLAISKLDRKKLKEEFHSLFDQEIKNAYLYYYHYITIQKSYPYTNLDLLELTLKDSFDAIIDFLVQIQAQIQKFEKGEYLAQSLHSTNPKTVSHAHETVQKLCTYKQYKKILPLIEEGHEKAFYKNYHQDKLPFLSLDELLDTLEKTASSVNRMIVQSLKTRLNIKRPPEELSKPSTFEPRVEALVH